MIPNFDPDGNLPPGIHPATIKEVEAKFATNFKRKVIFEGLLRLIDDLRKIGCSIIYLDGSYITTKELPGDMDICWDNTGIDLYNAFAIMPVLWDLDPPRREQQHLYTADIFPANIIEASSRKYFIDFFQCDKNSGSPKGIIQIEI
jgi:hypothetical protein